MGEFKELTQNTKIQFNLNGVTGNGRVVGKATTEQPFIGANYIIEPFTPINNETYNYSHFVCPQILLTEI